MIVLYLLLLAAGLCIIRTIAGPTTPDRVIAVDALGAIIIVLLVMFGIQYERHILLDVALAFAIITFIGTLAISKFLEGEKLFK